MELVLLYYSCSIFITKNFIFFRSQFAIIGDSLLEQLRAILVGDEEQEKEKDEDKMKKKEDVSRVFVMARQEELVSPTFLQSCLSLLKGLYREMNICVEGL